MCVTSKSNHRPNHALQRTAPRVTARAFCERSDIYICGVSVSSTGGHAPRHSPPSLSLGSLGAHITAMKTQRRLLGLIAALIHAPLIHAALTVDSFNTSQGPLTGAGTFNSVSGSGILGGERDVLLSSFPATSSFSIATGVLNLTQISGFTHIYATYDGADNSSALSMGLGGVNLLSSGTAFQVALLSTASSTPHAHLWLRAYTTASNYSEVHLVLDSTNFPSTLNIPFSTMDSFGGGATFSNINAVQMEFAIGSGINMDMHVDSVSIVPEPSTFVLFVIASSFVCFGRTRCQFKRCTQRA